MTIKNLQNKKICILGWGIENQALVKFLLKKKVKSEIIICDKKKVGTQNFAFPPKNIKWKSDKDYDKNLERYDIIFRAPGYPLSKLSRLAPLPAKRGNKREGLQIITSPMKLFFELCPTKNIIGVTGTKGKGTTASLIYRILKQAGRKVFLGGNIGVAPFAFIDKIKKNSWVILELSSFQLEDMEVSPRMAVITNFTAEHLSPADPNNPNYHHTLSAYWRAKANIFKWQKKNDYLIINKKLKDRLVGSPPPGKIKYFTTLDWPTKIVGDYNRENISAAAAAAKAAGVKTKISKQTVKNFKNLEHRLEFVKNIRGVKYYNDSFATTPTATAADLESFSAPIILLAGGADKGADFKKLARQIKKRVKFTVLLAGQATPRIKKALAKIKYPAKNIGPAKSMAQAVRIARGKSAAGDIVLLSPACASFGMFQNYKERGKLFKKKVKKLQITNPYKFTNNKLGEIK